MKKYLQIAFTTLILSFYFFPFNLRILPTVNTKTTMAGIGLVLLFFQLAKGRKALIDKDIFILSMYALVVSLFGFLSITYNETFDYTYATYIISMWVWLSAAYVVISLMRRVHGYASIYLLCNYLIGLCVVQCLLAITMDFYTPLKDVIFSVMDTETVEFMKKAKRLCGFGAALDIAGTRFASVLIMIVFLCISYPKERMQKTYPFYVVAFLVIAIIGNMISRTTTIGLILAILYFILFSKIQVLEYKKLWLWIIVISVVLISMTIYAYHNIPEVYEHIRFAFEGFFSLIEKGRWEVHSNEILESMYVFPDNLKTWIIGDGYFNNPYNVDSYYVGPKWIGFYKNTDVGYLRFIYYLGVLGLIAFSIYIYKVSFICANRFKNCRNLFFVFLLLNFIIWFKVSTDIFLVFALFLVVEKEENEVYENRFIYFLEVKNL